MIDDYKELKVNFDKAIKKIEEQFHKYNDLLIKQSILSEDFNSGFQRIEKWIRRQRQFTAQLISEVKEIEQKIRKIIDMVGVVSGEALELSQIITEVVTSIEQARQTVKNKEELLNRIADTSAQVDILARNAEIKSYHAGEEGKGFGVVAREMAQLALEVSEPVQKINNIAEEIIHSFSEVEENVAKIKEFKEITSGLSTTLKKTANDGIILLPFLKKSLDHVNKSLTDLNSLTTNLEHSASEIENWSSRAIETWEKSSITINQFVGVAQRVKDLINPVFKERLSKILQNYPLTYLNIQRSIELDQREITELLSEISRIQNDQTSALIELREKVSDWRDFLQELSKQFSGSRLEYKNLADFSLGLGDINKKIRNLNEYIKDLDLIFEKARLLSLYGRIEASRPKVGTNLLPVSTGMRDLSDKVSINSEKLKQEIDKLSDFTNELSGNLEKISSQIRKLGFDSEEAVGFFTEVTKKIDNLAQTIMDAEKELSKIDLAKTINTGEELAEIFGNLNELKITRDIENIVNLANNVDQLTKQWPKYSGVEKTLRIGMAGRPLLLDPGHRTDANSHRINLMIFAGLYQIDHRINTLPSLASSVELSSDGKAWTFHLQRGILFHDHKELKAKDVVYTLRHLLKGPNRAFAEMISGSKEYYSGNKNIVTGINVIDDYTIKILLDYPYLPFLATLASGMCDIIHEGFNPNKPIGCGPYQFSDWSGHIINLAAFDDFFEGKPLIDRVEYNLLPNIKYGIDLYLQDKLDIIPITSEFANMVPDDEIYTAPLLTFRYLGFNLKADTPFKDIRLRKAINMALDRERYVKECIGGWGIPASGIFPPNLSTYNPQIKELYRYDPDRARQLVSEVEGEHSYVLDVYNTETAIMRGEWISKELLKIGIRLEVNPCENLLEKTYRGRSILSMKGWLSDNGDPDNFLFPLFHSSSWGITGNTSFYTNKEVDQLIEKARTIRNKMTRDELYRKVEKEILADLPVVPLTHNFSGHAVKSRIKGFVPDPFDIIKPANLWIE